MTPEHEHTWANRQTVTVERLDVIAVTFDRGQGCCEKAPYRHVTRYYAADGRLLWEDDPLLDSIVDPSL